jgi:LysM repeat protein
MKRKDIIIISVLVNSGLLALLFITAVKSDSDLAFPVEHAQEVAEEHAAPPQETIVNRKEAEDVLFFNGPIVDEVDHVLKEYLPEIAVESPSRQSEPASHPTEKLSSKASAIASDPEEALDHNEKAMVDVHVKRGDALEKIARANHTTVEAIRKANRLTSDKLKIGQVLKVPVGSHPPKEKSPAKPTASESDEIIYYTIKNGDNPWKIAKSKHVSVEDLLKLNDLNEEKAKNLKAGDQIRVK